MIPSYNEIAQYYDWEHQRFADDLQMYLGFAAGSNGEILDAACGTGRTLVPLAEAGYRVTGVDSSPAMLGEARLKAGAVARRVKLVCADLRALALRHRFGMALVALGSFHHLTTLADQRSALRGLAEQLVRGGLLILDLVNPAPEWLAAGDGALVHQLTGPFPGESGPDLLSKFVARTSIFETQSDHQLLIYDRTLPDGTVSRRVLRMELRFLFRFEAELLLGEEGFKVRDVYGGYGLEPYDGSSSRMIYVAERQ